MNESAPNRPSFGVEEVLSEPTVVETIPPIPHTEFDAPPQPEQMPQQTQEVMPAPPVPGPPPNNEPSVSTSNLPPNGHNVHSGSHPIRKLLFLVPAVLLVATIYFVAKFTGNDFVVREPAPIVTSEPVDEPGSTPSPTPVPIELKSYSNEQMLLTMLVPSDYEVLSEDSESVSFGRDGTEVFIARTDEFTNYDDEDETFDVLVAGRPAVELNLDDEGSVPVRIVQLLDEPKYEFVMFMDDPNMSSEFQKIIDSVLFLVDTSDWETFENTTYNYQINYPPDWTEETSIGQSGAVSSRTEISRDPDDKEINNLVIQTSSNLENAALTASEIVSSTRTLSGWTGQPRIELKKIGGGDAQVIQGELSGEWRAYVVIWYKNVVVQMTWDDASGRPNQQVFENMLSSFEFTI